jgi:hypothetical protein
MILSGNTTWATQAAAEYATDAEHLGQLNQHLARCKDRAGRSDHSSFFQVLLRVEVKDNQPIGVSYITHHDLDISASDEGPGRHAAAGSPARSMIGSGRRMLSQVLAQRPGRPSASEPVR